MSIRCLYAPAVAAALGNLGLAILMLSPAVGEFAAGYLSDPGPVRSLALLLGPDEWLTAAKNDPGATAATVAYVVVALALVASWLWAVRAARPLRLDRVGPLLMMTALIAVPLLLAPRLQSSDVFLYDMYGRIISVHGANPLVDVPTSFPDDPTLSWVMWNVPSSYGPVWLMLSAMLSGLTQWSITAAVIGYRAAGLLVHLATATAVWHLLRRERPDAAAWGTVFYALNPMVLLELAGNAHNDGLVALFAVVLVGAAMRRAWVAAACAAAGAVMVKPFAVLLLPLLARHMAGPRLADVPWRRLLWAAAAGAATMLAVSLPLWAGTSLVHNVLTNPATLYYSNSLWEIASDLAVQWWHVDAEAVRHPYIDLARAAAFLGGAAWLLYKPVMRREFPAVAVRLWILFCVSVAWVWPWYLVPALALAPLAGRRLVPAAVGLTLGALLFWSAWPEARPGPFDGLWAWRALLLFGPLGLTAWPPLRTAVYVALGWQHRPRRARGPVYAGAPVPAEPAAG